VRDRLRSRGVTEEATASALATLSVAGFVDDDRLARGRAAVLADKGWGDAAITARLVGEGLAEAKVEAGLAELEPESMRAARLVAGRDPRKSWALLQRRGFDLETIEATLGSLDEGAAEG